MLSAAAVLAMLAGCAVRLGGPRDVEYRTLALEAQPGESVEAVAARIRDARASVVILAAPAESTWFAEAARLANLELSGPAPAGPLRLGFLADTPLGDTTLVLAVSGADSLPVQDALYRVDRYRYLNLLATRLEPGVDLRASVRAVLGYVATDVMHDAAVVLAVHVPDPATGDSLARLFRPVFRDASTCLDNGDAARALGNLRLFYGPDLRLECEAAELRAGPGLPLLARLVVPR